jgi:hypothetical protein
MSDKQPDQVDNDLSEALNDEDQPRKRRKTGWDQNTRVVVPVQNPAAAVVKPVTPIVPVIPTLSIPVATSNSQAALQATAAEITNKLALQQQLLARTSLINLIPQTKPGCRIYVG